MKKLICIMLALILVLGLCACGEGGSAKKEGLHVGFGRASIVPDQMGVQLAGGDASARLADGYLDEVSATCVAITEGDETVLLYTLDFIVVDEKAYSAQMVISAETGIPEENIILNATHTHSGVSIRSKWPGVEAYITKYQAATVQAAKDALEDLSPAEMYFGKTQTERLVFVRHYLMNDGTTYGNGHGTTESGFKEHLYPADEELQLIKFARPAEDKKDVVLMNLGAHATINSASYNAPKSISADWPAATRAYVEANTDSLCAVFEGAAGDQIPFSSIQGLSVVGNKHPDFGNKVGEYCVDVLNGEMTKAEGKGINVKVHNYTAPSMKEGVEDIQRLGKASEIAAIANAKGTSHPDVAAAVAQSGFGNVYEATGLVSRSKYPETYSMDLHMMTVDGVSFIFAPFEMFGVTGREIKDNSPYEMTFVVTCSENPGGHMGYIPHEYGCEEGFYEYDVTRFARGTAEDLAKTYVAQLTEMKNAG